MSRIEQYITEQIIRLVPNFDKLEVRANIGDNSSTVEFFVTVDGKKNQCFDMIDSGIIKEKEFDITVKAIAKYIRTLPEYKKGEINKVQFVTEK